MVRAALPCRFSDSSRSVHLVTRRIPFLPSQAELIRAASVHSIVLAFWPMYKLGCRQSNSGARPAGALVQDAAGSGGKP
jgi:hypothetical protein